MARGSIIVSKDVIYTNSENILRTDLIEVDINTKDTKINHHDCYLMVVN